VRVPVRKINDFLVDFQVQIEVFQCYMFLGFFFNKTPHLATKTVVSCDCSKNFRHCSIIFAKFKFSRTKLFTHPLENTITPIK